MEHVPSISSQESVSSQESAPAQTSPDESSWDSLTKLAEQDTQISQADQDTQAEQNATPETQQLTPDDLPSRERKILDAKRSRLQYQYRQLYGQNQAEWPDGAAAGLEAALDTIEQESLYYYSTKQAAPEGSNEFFTAAANSVIFDSYNRGKFADMLANPRTAQRAQNALSTLECLAASDVDGAVAYLNSLKARGEGNLVAGCVRDVAKLADEDMDGLVELLIKNYDAAPAAPAKQSPLLDRIDDELVGVNHQSRKPRRFPWQRDKAA